MAGSGGGGRGGRGQLPSIARSLAQRVLRAGRVLSSRHGSRAWPCVWRALPLTLNRSDLCSAQFVILTSLGMAVFALLFSLILKAVGVQKVGAAVTGAGGGVL